MALRRSSWAAILAPTLLVSACEFGFGPEDVEGRRYVLESISSDPLPATLAGEGWSYQVLADTIWFDHDDQRGTQARITVWPGQAPDRADMTFDYVVRNGRVEVTYHCPPGASCIEGPHLLLARRGDDLRATYPPTMQIRDDFLYRARGR